ncbi:hypothetical protein [Bacillus pumilus]|uniref:hypothetical protein n=1 Tax=Bacillus pumilus TaxID=1408 RepID=UPI003D71BC1E
MMHVLKDEKLGVDREYVAVDRDAEVGEKIIVIDSPIYPKGHVSDVIKLGRFSEVYADGSCYLAEGVDGDNYIEGMCEHYHVLEPTDIIHIDGERYRLEDRKAEVGEEVIAKNVDGKWPKLVSEVLIRLRYSVIINGRIINGKKATFIDHGFYYVLTPVQDDPEPKESDVITVLANLGAEVAELKRKNEQFEKALGWNEMGPGYIPEIRNGLSELKSVVSNYESEIGRMQAEINALHEDKVRLGEQLAKVTADDPRALSFTADEFAQIIVSLSRAGL